MWMWMWKKQKHTITVMLFMCPRILILYVGRHLSLNASILNIIGLEDKTSEEGWQIIMEMHMIFIHTYVHTYNMDKNGQDHRMLKLEGIWAFSLTSPSLDGELKQSCVRLRVGERIVRNDARICLNTFKTRVSHIGRNKNSISKISTLSWEI